MTGFPRSMTVAFGKIRPNEPTNSCSSGMPARPQLSPLALGHPADRSEALDEFWQVQPGD